MIVYSIRSEECGSHYQGRSSDSVAAVRKTAEAAGWQVVVPAKFEMLPQKDLDQWPEGRCHNEHGIHRFCHGQL